MNGLRIIMGQRFKSFATFCALAALPIGWASAQVATGRPQPATQVPPAAVPRQSVPPGAVPALPYGAPGAQPVPAVPAPAPVVLPPPVWDARDAEALLMFIEAIGGEGLDPKDYDPAGLADALKTGSVAAIS